MEPIYTAENTYAAYQLNWSLALFGKSELPDPALWLDSLRGATEKDRVRVLSYHRRSTNVLQFLISTLPHTSPAEIVRVVKGRLQYLVRDCLPHAFRRNYHVQSTGAATSKVLDRYVAGQTAKHPMADASVQTCLEAIQFEDVTIDVSRPVVGTYGQYLNALQIVVENAGAWHEIRETQLRRVRDMIVRTAGKKKWRLSRIGLLSNHVHVLLSASVTESPQSIALSLMNNIAFVYGMKPVLKYSYYAGTFGSYNRGAMGLHER
ncbi:hypothetical protein [Aureliella helgolandensis]|uniref:Transposase IS200 like protein n=1 Tax=Aureliella helgolandensis TaxID=2527968 RepID=A0A518G5D4_9BACT|nr:hypothetical protein [Aureliella helgolandensis]QDV23769.1 Transposase IS200 like protein [Aureliella helgolandensis]